MGNFDGERVSGFTIRAGVGFQNTGHGSTARTSSGFRFKISGPLPAKKGWERHVATWASCEGVEVSLGRVSCHRDCALRLWATHGLCDYVTTCLRV